MKFINFINIMYHHHYHGNQFPQPSQRLNTWIVCALNVGPLVTYSSWHSQSDDLGTSCLTFLFCSLENALQLMFSVSYCMILSVMYAIFAIA